MSAPKLRLADACIEDVDYAPRRELDRGVVRQLATCRWVAEHQNVLITGATGTGKSYLARALAQQACRKGYRAIYRSASRFFSELALARLYGTYVRPLTKLARADVFILDDWAMAKAKEDERRDLLEVPEETSSNHSDQPASLRSDHDTAFSAITMVRFR